MMAEPHAARGTQGRAADPAASRPVGRSAGSRSAKTKFAEVVVVCAKCAKRQGLRAKVVCARLRKAGKKAAQDRPSSVRRKLCVVESGCLGPCPKRAVAIATGESLAAGRVILIDPDAIHPDNLDRLLRPTLPRRAAPEFGPNTALAARAPDESPSPP
jgi:hypothetical protein